MTTLKNIETYPAKTTDNELITPEEFLALTPSQKLLIKKIDIIPPKLGEKGFGMFKITYIDPLDELDALFYKKSLFHFPSSNI